jgi:hypothetical protein
VGGFDAVRASLQVSHDDLAAPLSKQGRGVKRKLNDSPKQGTRNFPFILFLDRAQLSSLSCHMHSDTLQLLPSSAHAHGILSMT